MDEAQQLHRDLMKALLPILPRTIYHDTFFLAKNCPAVVLTVSSN